MSSNNLRYPKIVQSCTSSSKKFEIIKKLGCCFLNFCNEYPEFLQVKNETFFDSAFKYYVKNCFQILVCNFKAWTEYNI